jgi:integral membrane protein
MVERLRHLGLIEGTSFLILLFVAMPLKYLADRPAAVTWVGWAHGALFLAYVLQLALVFFLQRWPFWRGALLLLAALVPFGPFLLDRRMKEYARQAGPAP